MNLLLAVALGGALGSAGRFLLSKALMDHLGTAFPYGTLAVNVLGSFAAGGLYVLLAERMDAAPEWRALLIAGVLGGFTTFSAFSLETMALAQRGALALAGANAALNLVLSLGACALGIWAVRA